MANKKNMIIIKTLWLSSFQKKATAEVPTTMRKNRNFSDFNLQNTTLRCHACLLRFLEMTVKLHIIYT